MLEALLGCVSLPEGMASALEHGPTDTTSQGKVRWPPTPFFRYLWHSDDLHF